MKAAMNFARRRRTSPGPDAVGLVCWRLARWGLACSGLARWGLACWGLVCWGLALVLGSCGSPQSSDAGVTDARALEPRVELGTGRSGFVEIPDDNAELELVAGPQGGFHVDLTARLWNLALDGVRLRYEARPIDSETPISLPTELALTPARFVREGDHWLRAGDFLQMDVAGPPDVVGMELEVTVEATDPSGRSASHTRRARIVDRE
jgi:hypothetical protein